MLLLLLMMMMIIIIIIIIIIECRSRSDASNNRDNWNHLKINHNTSEQHSGKAWNQGTTGNSHIDHYTKCRLYQLTWWKLWWFSSFPPDRYDLLLALTSFQFIIYWSYQRLLLIIPPFIDHTTIYWSYHHSILQTLSLVTDNIVKQITNW